MNGAGARAAAGAALLAVLGCGSADGDAELAPRDARYRAVFDSVSSEALELRFEPREGWHIEPEAVAHLSLAAPEGFAVEPAEQDSERALEHREEGLVFGLSLRRLASGSESEAPLRGSVKFGVCRDDASICEIVRRDLELLAPADS